MKKHIPPFLPLMFPLLFCACEKDNEMPTYCPSSDELSLIHIAHTRTPENYRLNEYLEWWDFSQYDLRLLGGDLSEDTSLDTNSMDLCDDVFNLGNPNTLWALGNHDYNNPGLVSEYTLRPTYYTYTVAGMVFLVLDTQITDGRIDGVQLDMVNQVLDTLTDASHLILLHHKLMWMPGHPELEPLINSVANGVMGDCGYCTNPGNFYDDIYPRLVETKQAGKEVICIGGDLGVRSKTFEYLTDEGILFLASGTDEDEDDATILLRYDEGLRTLSWEFDLLANACEP